MRTRWTILTTVTLLSASMLFAQRGPRDGEGRGPSFDGLVAALNLTDGQLSQLQENAKASREETRALMQEIRPLHEQIKAELDKPSPDPAVVGDLTVQVDAIRDQIGENRKNSHAAALALLTPAQQEALTALTSAEEKNRETFGVIRTAAMLNLLEGRGMGFGPGGHGGFGPGGFGPGGFGPGHGHGDHEGMRGPGRRGPQANRNQL